LHVHLFPVLAYALKFIGHLKGPPWTETIRASDGAGLVTFVISSLIFRYLANLPRDRLKSGATIGAKEEMTKAERFCNSVQDEQMSDDVLLATARAVSGQDPEVYDSVRTEGAGECYFRFDDGSILTVDIMERDQPSKRRLSVQIPPSSSAAVQ
jgi:hypothetical protein